MDVRVNSARQNLRLDIAPDGHIIGRVLRMGDARHVLFDDRAFIEIGGDIMGRRANKFHAALIGLLVRVRAFEGRQEGMVDIDDAARLFWQNSSERTCI